MRRSAWKILVATALAASVLPGAALTARTLEQDNPRYSSNFEPVARIAGIGGSDIEFFTRTLESYKGPDGEMVTPDEPVERHFAFVGSYQTPWIVDITDPEKPYKAVAIPNCAFGQGDPQVSADGMLAAIAKQGGGSCRNTVTKQAFTGDGSAFIDLSDVYDPKVIGWAPVSGGSHNHTFHPGGKYVYVSPSTAMPGGPGNSAIPIFDISDPAKPRFVKTFTTPGNGPHDVRFSADGKRAYVASVSTYYILNTENPENPSVISTIVPPGGTIGHDTLVSPDGAFLILGDEAGGGLPFPCPGGAIFAYDIRNESMPVYLGMAEAGGGPVVGRPLGDTSGIAGVGGCTSHVMELNPDGKSLTIGWYVLGTRTFSFASFYGADGKPKSSGNIAAAWGKYGVGLIETGFAMPESSSTWAAKQYAKVPGYIFSNASGTGGGLHVTKIKGPNY